VSFDAHPGLSIPRNHCVAGRPVVQSRPVREHGESRPTLLCFGLGSASPSCSRSASRVLGSCSGMLISIPPAYARAFANRRPIAVGAPTISRAWSPCGMLSSRGPSRRCLLSGCVDAARSPDSIERAPRLVNRKQPVVALASWLTSRCSSFARPMVPQTWPPSTTAPIRTWRLTECTLS